MKNFVSKFQKNPKTEYIKYYEKVIRNYFGIGNTDFFVFNKDKNVSNGQADFVFHKSKKNMVWENIYVKLFYATKGCNFKIGYNKIKTILKKDGENYRANQLNYIALCSGYDSIVFITPKDLDSIISKLTPDFYDGDTYKSYLVHFDSVIEKGILLRCQDDFYSVKEIEKAGEIKQYKDLLHTTLPKESFCLPDKRIGADFMIIDTNGGKPGFATIHQLVTKIIIDNTDTLAVKALDQKIRRYIAEQKYTVEKNNKIEPFTYTGFVDYKLFILDPNVFATTETFAEYQKKAEQYINKTADMESYQKDYQKDYQGQICIYEGKEYKLGALVKKLQRAGIEKPTLEAKKYLVK